MIHKSTVQSFWSPKTVWYSFGLCFKHPATMEKTYPEFQVNFSLELRLPKKKWEILLEIEIKACNIDKYMYRYLVKVHFIQDTDVQGSDSDRQIRSHGPTRDLFHGDVPGPVYPFSSFIISLTIEKRRWLLFCGHCKFSGQFCHFWSTKYVMDDTETTRMIMLMIKCKLFISRFNENVKNLHSEAYKSYVMTH